MAKFPPLIGRGGHAHLVEPALQLRHLGPPRPRMSPPRLPHPLGSGDGRRRREWGSRLLHRLLRIYMVPPLAGDW